MNHKIEKLLIANRGEIALRILRACRQLGIPSVSVASEADAKSLFARSAEELVIIGPAPAKESYLNAEKLISVARERGCNAIHPGYGFLSENAQFAKMVEEAGLIFVGPRSETIALLGNKTAAKERVSRAGVPCAPSSPSGISDQELLTWSREIGFPLLIKAAAGGGGRGMRKILDPDELAPNIPRARAEAQKFFSNPDIYFEKLIDRPRHVEVQIFGDMHGNVVHFGTRDCSTQRRHQKIIEEAPAPCLSDHMRAEIQDAAVRAAKSAGYYNAGTVEFLLEGESFYFMEVNTRIQVEHPVTEAVTGVDLVQLQLKIAEGEPLPMAQEDIQFEGHAIEFRICVEDPSRGFLPGGGVLTELSWKENPDLRSDFGFESGDEIPLYYDSMIGKVIVKAPSRAACIDKSIEILRSYVIQGVPHNVALHRYVLYNGLFRQGPVDIGFIERELPIDYERQVIASELKDPAWQEPRGGAEVKNIYEYTSKKFNTTYTIEVLHRRDGFFFAVPCDAAGRRARNLNCRMSNGFDEVLKSLIDDVLEKKSPSEVFAH